jgi:hypothetical protein
MRIFSRSEMHSARARKIFRRENFFQLARIIITRVFHERTIHGLEVRTSASEEESRKEKIEEEVSLLSSTRMA